MCTPIICSGTGSATVALQLRWHGESRSSARVTPHSDSESESERRHHDGGSSSRGSTGIHTSSDSGGGSGVDALRVEAEDEAMHIDRGPGRVARKRK
jgi:hypothetical protein